MRARQNNMIHLSSTFPFVSHSAGKALTPSHSELSGATTLQTTKTSSATASLAILSACARASSRVVNPLLWHPSGQYEPGLPLEIEPGRQFSASKTEIQRPVVAWRITAMTALGSFVSCLVFRFMNWVLAANIPPSASHSRTSSPHHDD